jgi:hypothetical protein
MEWSLPYALSSIPLVVVFAIWAQYRYAVSAAPRSFARMLRALAPPVATTGPGAPPVRAARRGHEGRRTLALFLACLGFYLLTASGHFYAADEETVFRVTEGLIERHTFAVPDTWGVIGTRRDGEGALYAQYTPGQALAALPLYLLGKGLARSFPAAQEGFITRFCVSLLNAFVTAATVALLYRLARLLRYGARPALALALIYAVASGAWPHGRTFFAEPLTALLLLLSFALIESWVVSRESREGMVSGTPPVTATADPATAHLQTTGDRRSTTFPLTTLFASGLAALGAVVVKPQGAIALPILGLFLIGRVWASGAGDRRARLWRAVRAAAAWGLGLALAAIPFALYNSALYGGPLSTGYGAGTPDVFRTPFLTGLYGLTLSSGKGILWYTPPIVLAVAGWWGFSRRGRAAALACLGMLIAHLGFYSRVDYWHGDGSWGPRYLAIALPFLLLPAVSVLEGLRARPIRRALVGALVALGIAVQLLGVTVNFDWYLLRSDEGARHFAPAASPLLAHARILAGRSVEWRYRLAPPPGTALLSDGFSYAEGAAGVGATGAAATGEALFPRWTTGAGVVQIYPTGDAPLTIKLTFFDHRPPARRTEPATVLLDGAALPDGAVERRDVTGNGEGWIYQFQTAPPDSGRAPVAIALRSATWNPKASGAGERDEEVGVFVHNVEVWQGGRALTVREGLAIAPLPDTPRSRFWWADDDAVRHHLADSWAWYVAVSGLGPARVAPWLGGYAAVAVALMAAGVALGWRTLPPRARRGGRRRATHGRRRMAVAPR